MVCPHAVDPSGAGQQRKTSRMLRLPLKTKAAHAARTLQDISYRMQVSPLDCTGCGNCADVCPAKEKALIMKPLADSADGSRRPTGTFRRRICLKPDIKFNRNTVKNSQFLQPLFEFSGACAGCGETPYIKLITQLFGDRMMVANATGCSSIYGGSSPTCPYTIERRRAMARRGRTLCSKTTPNLAMA